MERVERFCADNGMELLFMLSYGEDVIRSVLDGSDRFDQGFVDWLKRRSHPVVDLCESFTNEFEHSTLRSRHVRAEILHGSPHADRQRLSRPGR